LALISGYLAAGTNPELLSSLFVTLMTLSYFAQRHSAGFSGALYNRVATPAGLTLAHSDEAGA